MVDYDKLPSAPSLEEREAMVEEFMESEDYTDDEISESLIKHVMDGNVVIIRGNLLSITKEGYNLFLSIDKSGLN